MLSTMEDNRRTPPVSRTLTTLTTLQKQKIVAERDSRKEKGQSASLLELAHWARDKFSLRKAPGKATLSRILNSPNVGTNTNASKRCIARTQRQRKGRLHFLEQALFDWVISQQSRRIAVSGDIIKARAGMIQEAVLEKLPHERSFDPLKFSDGWLANFKKRWNLRFFKLYGESGDADIETLDTELPTLKEIVRSYDPKDVFNAAECGLFYSMPPDRAISRERLPGRKKPKERITFMPCSNADGSEKLELMVISKFLNPRAFKKKSGQGLGFDYHANKKAWMTAALFFEWLERFQTYVAKRPERKVLLLIDNCSAHGNKEALPSLPNVRVEYFPPKCTSIVQPMDAGIIAALKLRYKRRHMERALENMEVQTEDVYKVDILTAMTWFKSAWHELPCEVIKNCWHHAGLIIKPGMIAGEKSAEVQESESLIAVELQGHVQNLLPPSSRIDTEAVVSPEGENDGIVEELTDEIMVENALADYIGDDHDVTSTVVIEQQPDAEHQEVPGVARSRQEVPDAQHQAVVRSRQEAPVESAQHQAVARSRHLHQFQTDEDEEEVPKPEELLRAIALVRREAERERVAGLDDFLRISRRLQDGIRARVRACHQADNQ